MVTYFVSKCGLTLQYSKVSQSLYNISHSFLENPQHVIHAPNLITAHVLGCSLLQFNRVATSQTQQNIFDKILKITFSTLLFFYFIACH